MIIALWALIVLSILFIIKLLLSAYARGNAETDISAVDESSKVMADITRTYERQVELLELQRDAGDIDASKYESLKTELDRQLLQDYELYQKPQSEARKGSSIVAIIFSLLVLSAFAGYFYWQWQDEEQDWLAVKSENATLIEQSIENGHIPVDAVFESVESFQNFLRSLHSQVLAEQFENTDTLRVLANSYLEGQIYDMAAPLYEKLLETPEQADYTTRLAYVRSEMLANDGRLSPDTAPLLEQLFREDPNTEVLYLLGLGAFNTGNYQISLTSWRPVLESFTPGTEEYQSLQELMREAEANLQANNQDQSAASETPEESTASPEAPAAAVQQNDAGDNFVPGLSADTPLPAQPDFDFQIPVQVSIDEAARAHILEKMNTAVDLPQLVVYARTAEMPMPVAVNRFPVTDADIAGDGNVLNVMLQEQNSLLPNRLLSQQANIELGARIAFTQDMRAQDGDAQSNEIAVVITDNQSPETQSLTINQVIAQ